MKSDIVVIFIATVLSIGYPAPISHSITDPDPVAGYLRKYGYMDDLVLENGKPIPLIANIQLTPEKTKLAISRLQAYANLNVTGMLDEPTLRLMGAPRCGIQDMETEAVKVRTKRVRRSVYKYKWDSIKDITWQWDVRGSSDLNRLSKPSLPYVLTDLVKAFDTWSKGTMARFRRVTNGDCDIRIKFARKEHGCGYDFDGTGHVLAHAFYPYNSEQFGGDVHFDSDETWSAGGAAGDSTRSMSLFHVALHEIGHAIGLPHNNNPQSIMYPWYSEKLVNADSPNLPVDDSLAFYELYVEHYSDFALKNENEEGRLTKNNCDVVYGPYDDMTRIGQEILVVKGGMLWRWYSGRPIETGKHPLADHFPGLPKDKTIDAFHYDHRYNTFIIIIGNDLFEYRNPGSSNMIMYRHLSVFSDVGVYFKVDTIFEWQKSETYIFTGNSYWSLDVEHMKAYYEGRISDRWSGMFSEYDAVFTYNDSGRAYFVKNNWYWEVDMATGKPSTYKPVVGNLLPGCKQTEHDNALLVSSHSDVAADYIKSSSDGLCRYKHIYGHVLFVTLFRFFENT